MVQCGDGSTPQAHGFQRLRARGIEAREEMDEWASDIVGYDVFPRPTDCGMPVDVASQEKAGCIVRHRGSCLGAGACCRRLRHGVPDDVADRGVDRRS